SDGRYQAQRRITQLLQTELLQLYSRVETEAPAGTASGSPPGGRADSYPCAETRLGCLSETQKLCHRSLRNSPRGSSTSTLSPQQPKASNSSRTTGTSLNGSQDLVPPLLVEPSLLCPYANPLVPLPPSDAPLTVGSYPSTKSFLGMRARQLFRNKSESQCDDEEEEEQKQQQLPPALLAGLAHGLKTGLCVEPPTPGGPRQRLKIMDYNETHQEHS
uniref:TSC complex subunit 1b n=1 Tax=Gasterosteus aculeatus TaxID=69293 RepID=G3Q270_GASAC